MKSLNKKLAESIRAYMIAQSETIAVAESVTSGLLQWYMSSIPDASKFFQGGITAYNVGQKYKHLQVEPLYAISVNCISARVAAEMARHCCCLFASKWSIAVTGYASAVPDSGGERFAFYAIAQEDEIVAEGKIIPPDEHPEQVQLFYAREIFKILGEVLNKKSGI
ncbi:MAG: CinA family protein [Chitinophagaceae bacterium]|nr:CinA family protein [Chitinophagaceae bacterium]